MRDARLDSIDERAFRLEVLRERSL